MKLLNAWLLILSVCLCSCINDDRDLSPTGENLSVGDKIPQFQIDLFIPDSLDWRVSSLSSSTLSTPCITVNSNDLRGKRVYLLFFNTTCKDCQKEFPEVQSLYEKVRSDSNYVFMAVAREQGREAIEEYWKQNGLTLPYSEQNDRRIYNLFASQNIPLLYVIDEDGIINERHFGF